MGEVAAQHVKEQLDNRILEFLQGPYRFLVKRKILENIGL